MSEDDKNVDQQALADEWAAAMEEQVGGDADSGDTADQAAVKAVEFGDGFNLADIKGSQANDSFFIDDNDCIKTKTNSNGGILGGITNGMPIVYRAAIKPTPSISIKQDTVDKANMVNTSIEVSGRHDPCIVKRAVPVMDAAAALVILDILLGCGCIYNKMTL